MLSRKTIHWSSVLAHLMHNVHVITQYTGWSTVLARLTMHWSSVLAHLVHNIHVITQYTGPVSWLTLYITYMSLHNTLVYCPGSPHYALVQCPGSPSACHYTIQWSSVLAHLVHNIHVITQHTGPVSWLALYITYMSLHSTLVQCPGSPHYALVQCPGLPSA